MTAGPRATTGRGLPGPDPIRWGACLAAPLVAGSLLAQPASAQTGLAVGQPATVPAARACFTDTVRVSGYVFPRGDSYVSINIEGFRVTEVLVREEDNVQVDQDLIRLARVGDDSFGAGRGLPPTAVLKAPASGTVVRRNVRVGQLTKAGTDPMLRIVTDPAPELMADVPSLYAGRIKAGATARILTEDGRELPATVRLPAADIDPATQFGRARVALAPGATLRLGSFARALIDTGQSCGVAVPRSAILRQSDATSVMVVRDGQSEIRPVRVGLSSDTRVEIRDGVAEGEAVVANAALGF